MEKNTHTHSSPFSNLSLSILQPNVDIHFCSLLFYTHSNILKLSVFGSCTLKSNAYINKAGQRRSVASLNLFVDNSWSYFEKKMSKILFTIVVVCIAQVCLFTKFCLNKIDFNFGFWIQKIKNKFFLKK